MKVIYHPAVQDDLNKILKHYDAINSHLGDEFWDELNSFIQAAAKNPIRYHFERRNRRRVNLKRFPFHFLFRETSDGIRITVITSGVLPSESPGFNFDRSKQVKYKNTPTPAARHNPSRGPDCVLLK